MGAPLLGGLSRKHAPREVPNIYEWTEASEAEEDASVRIYMGMKRASYLGRPLGISQNTSEVPRAIHQTDLSMPFGHGTLIPFVVVTKAKQPVGVESVT